ARTLLVFEPGQPELFVAGPPHPDLVVMQIDQPADRSIRLAVGHEQDHPRSFGRSSLDRVGPHARFELSTVTSTKFEWRKSHPSMKSHQCYYREDPLGRIVTIAQTSRENARRAHPGRARRPTACRCGGGGSPSARSG